MKDINNYIGSLCIAIYIIGIIFNLIKIKHTNKIMQTVLGLVLLINILNPIAVSNINVSFEGLLDTPVVENNIENEEYIIQNAKIILEEEIKTLLNQKNIAYKSIEVHIHKENGSFFIKEISIYGSEDEEKEIIIEALSDILDTDCLIFRGDYG